MGNQTDDEAHFNTRMILLSRILGVLIGLIGLGVIVGWIFDIQFLKSIFPQLITMKVNTAILFILTSSSILLLHQRVLSRHVIAKILAILIFIVGFLTTLEYVLGYDLYLDQLFLKQENDTVQYHPAGRMAPITAVLFMITSIALILTDNPRDTLLRQISIIVIGSITLFVLIGFTYHMQGNFIFFRYTYLALPTATNFILVFFSLLFMRPNEGVAALLASDTEGGEVARKLLPAAIVIPVLLGYVKLIGEYENLFDREYAFAIIITSNIVIFVLFILYVSNKLMRSNISRLETSLLLVESEQRWKYALENANQGVWDWDIPKNKVYYSHAWKKMLGYEDSEINNELYEFESRVHPDDYPEVKKQLEAHFNGESEEYICEARYRCKDGAYKWILDRGKVVARSSDGAVLRAIGTHTDISQLKERIESQRIAADKLEFSLNAAQIGSWTMNVDTHCIVRTLLHDKIFGYISLLPEWTFDMFLGQVHPDDRKKVDIQFNHAIENNVACEFKCRIFRADNHEMRWIWVCVKKYMFGDQSQLIGLVQDITTSVELEKSLHDALLYNRSLIEASLDPLVTINKDGKISDVNTATEVITGVSRNHLIGSDFSNYFTEPDKAKKGYLQVFREGFVKDYRLTINNVDGHLFEVMYNAVVYKNESGNVQGVFAAARDVTERLRAENKAKQYALELQRSNSELQQFAYIASHDLQEPLRVITSYLELIDRRYKGSLDNDIKDFIKFAVDSAKRLQQMVNDLLTYSRVETKAKPFEKIDSKTALLQSVENLQLTITDSHAKISYDNLPVVVADANQLTVLFQNLISNAIKFRKPNEVPVIHVSVNRKQNKWEFCVTDNGIGIDPKYKDKLFVIFKRLVGREYAGSGIGLAVCKRIIDRHGGEIWVESELGKGCTFYFTIPDREIEDGHDKNC